MSDEFRQQARATGRTTRMLEQAIQYAKDGKAVAVVVAHSGAFLHTRAIALHLAGTYVVEQAELRHLIQFYSGGSIRFHVAEDRDIDWRWATITGYSYARVFFDHYAIETYLALALKELHRYDLQEETL